MGKKKVRFNCTHCGHCCTDVICLPTPWDVKRVARMTGESPNKFLEFVTADEIGEVEDSDPTWLECQGERYLMALRRGKKGCFFLDKKSLYCRIYDARPILCRLYPFKLNETRKGEYKSFTLHSDVGCPRHTDGTMETAPLYELYQDDARHQEDYEDLVCKFNSRRPKKRKPKDFIKLFYDAGRD